MKTWKKAEQRAAAKFGTRRAPLSGSNGGVTGSDSLSESCYIETKYRQKHWAVSLFHEVEEAAGKEKKLGGIVDREGKFPVLILAEKGRHRLFALCPLEAGYLQILANQLKAHEPKEGYGASGDRVECTNHDDGFRWSEAKLGEHKP